MEELSRIEQAGLKLREQCSTGSRAPRWSDFHWQS